MKHASQLLLLAALALPVTGCNDPLNVQDPDVVPPGNLNNKSVLPTIRAGAIGDFALAYTGSGADGSGGTVEGVTMYGGLLADEWINSETFPTRIEVDSRGPIQKTEPSLRSSREFIPTEDSSPRAKRNSASMRRAQASRTAFTTPSAARFAKTSSRA